MVPMRRQSTERKSLPTTLVAKTTPVPLKFSCPADCAINHLQGTSEHTQGSPQSSRSAAHGFTQRRKLLDYLKQRCSVIPLDPGSASLITRTSPKARRGLFEASHSKDALPLLKGEEFRRPSGPAPLGFWISLRMENGHRRLWIRRHHVNLLIKVIPVRSTHRHPETGMMARQATAQSWSAWTISGPRDCRWARKKRSRTSLGIFPLTVNYIESAPTLLVASRAVLPSRNRPTEGETLTPATVRSVRCSRRLLQRGSGGRHGRRNPAVFSTSLPWLALRCPGCLSIPFLARSVPPVGYRDGQYI